MVRVRENSKEFGACSRVNKVFREALHSFYSGIKFPDFHSRLMGLLTRLKDLDEVGRRGERSVSEGIKKPAGMQLLRQFDYTPACSVHKVFPFPFEVDPESFELDFADFDIGKVRFVEGANCIELNYGLLNFNFETLEYSLHRIEPVLLKKDFERGKLKLTPGAIPEGHGILMAILGVRYYQEINGETYVLNSKNAVGISVLGVF
ncbi:MAG: hypothetical protein WCY25_10140 [Moheibacter sp.]